MDKIYILCLFSNNQNIYQPKNEFYEVIISYYFIFFIYFHYYVIREKFFHHLFHSFFLENRLILMLVLVGMYNMYTKSKLVVQYLNLNYILRSVFVRFYVKM